MGRYYTSYCEKCKLAIENGKDYSGLRHELFKLYHNYRFKDHIIEKYDDDQWIDKWLNDEQNEPEELYDEKLGYLIYIPQWLEELIEVEIEYWIKNESGLYRCKDVTEEDIIRKIIEMNQDKLLTECLNEFEYRLKRVLTINDQYDRLKDRQIELLPKQRLTIFTYHGEFYIDDRLEDVNLFAVRNGERLWIARLIDKKILKYGAENEPKYDDFDDFNYMKDEEFNYMKDEEFNYMKDEEFNYMKDIEEFNYMKDIEEFKRDLELQEKKVYEKINPILELYNKNKITKKELIEKLSEAFYELEDED